MPELNTFPASAAVKDIAASIQVQGYAIIHDMLDASGLARLRAELEPRIAMTPGSHEAFMGARTVRFGCLLARCEEPRAMVLHPLLLELVESVLGAFCARFQLNYTGVMHLLPGEEAQVVHRDAAL